MWLEGLTLNPKFRLYGFRAQGRNGIAKALDLSATGSMNATVVKPMCNVYGINTTRRNEALNRGYIMGLQGLRIQGLEV